MRKQKTFITTSLVLCLLLSTVQMLALDYSISFTASGASSVIDNVVVQNLTKGTSVIVPAGNLLRLTDLETSVNSVNSNLSTIDVFPNPFIDNASVSFFVKNEGNARIDVFGIDGKKHLSSTNYLKAGIQSLKLTLPTGVYLIQVAGTEFLYTKKIISHALSKIKTDIKFSESQFHQSSPQKTQAPTETVMIYNTNDHLIYKGISGIYATIITDVPTENKNINFEFLACTDADGNNYPIVNIGGQIWMAENLRTTKYCSGSNITLESNLNNWSKLMTGAYVIYNNIGSNEPIYGKIYNGHAALNPNNICPCEWHVPTDAEWTIFTTHLGGEATAGTKLKITGTSFWNEPNSGTNEVGFSALPAGSRSNLGYFGELGATTYFMTSTVPTDPKYILLRGIGNGTEVFKNESVKTFGGSVRCLKN